MDNLEFGFQDIMEFIADTQPGPAEKPAAGVVKDERRAHSMFQFDDERKLPALIKVIGVGGCGGNAVSTMVKGSITGVEFIAANTDMQALENTKAPLKIHIGSKLTNGRGAGSNPEVGRQAALEDSDKIRSVLDGAEMVFVTAGMGGGTGTGGAPVVAQIARELGALTVAVVTKPFDHEGELRKRRAEEGLAELKKNVDAFIVIPNQRLLNLADRGTPIMEGFRMADNVLVQAVKGITDLVLLPGYMNMDFADIKTVMANKGRAVMGTGSATGEGRATEAAHRAISSPLLEDGSIKGARGVLINITGGQDISMLEYDEVVSVLKNEVDAAANIKVGLVQRPGEEITVTVVATGFDEEGIRDRVKRPAVSVKDFRKEAERFRKKQESFNFKHEPFDSDGEDLDKPTFLRRQAD